MKELGEELQYKREEMKIGLQEAADDLKVDKELLSNIEKGELSTFKDVYNAKTTLAKYAKYLGLDVTKTLDSYNEYMFDFTSKLPRELLEQAVDKKEPPIRSPYTAHLEDVEIQETNKILKILFIILLVLFAILLGGYFILF